MESPPWWQAFMAVIKIKCREKQHQLLIRYGSNNFLRGFFKGS